MKKINVKAIQKEIKEIKKELKEVEYHYKNKTMLDGEIMINESEYLDLSNEIEFKIKNLEIKLKNIDNNF